jgi:hypothetical protein
VINDFLFAKVLAFWITDRLVRRRNRGFCATEPVLLSEKLGEKKLNSHKEDCCPLGAG